MSQSGPEMIRSSWSGLGWSQLAIAVTTTLSILPLCLLLLAVATPFLIMLLLVGVMGAFFGSMFRFVRPRPLTAKRVRLPDGRHVAWHEQGVPRQHARHTIVMLHAVPDCRMTGIPGVTHSLLERHGVRVVSYDRPGYGQSAYAEWTLRTAAEDIEGLADALHLPPKFWILGYSGGAPLVWAAAKWIPHRLAGVALWAPDGNPWWRWIPPRYRKQVWREMALPTRLRFLALRVGLHRLASVMQWGLPILTHPILLPFFYAHSPLPLSSKDRAKLREGGVKAMLAEMVSEGLCGGSLRGVCKDMALPCQEWGFEMTDLMTLEMPIHIWQGSDDVDVSPRLTRLVATLLTRAKLHWMEGEGHYSAFVANDCFHEHFLKTLFGKPLGMYDAR